jgi:hypothetical protein
MFDLADPAKENQGAHTIIQELVARGWRIGRARVPTNQTVVRILSDRSVLGEYMPHYQVQEGRRPIAGDPVVNYYPAVIAVDQFARVQEGLRLRARKGRGRRTERCSNLFPGLLYDARDGRRLYLRRCNGKAILVNRGALTREALWIGLDYARLEKALLGLCRRLAPAEVFPLSAGNLGRAEGELADCLGRIERAQARLDGATDPDEEEVLTAQLGRLVGRRRALEAAVDKARAEAGNQPAEQMGRLRTLLEVLKACPPEELPALRHRIAALAQCLVKGIYVWVQRKGKPRRYLKRAVVWVEFVSGAWQKFLINSDGLDFALDYDCEADVNFIVDTAGGWE